MYRAYPKMGYRENRTRDPLAYRENLRQGMRRYCPLVTIGRRGVQHVYGGVYIYRLLPNLQE